jgi:integrase
VIDSMPKPRPPYLLREINRHGNPVWYVRKGDGPRIRIRGEYDSPQFKAAYQAALEGKASTDNSKAASGSLRWLVERYRDSSAWTSLSLATRKQRENILRPVLETAGHQSIEKIGRKEVVAGRDRRRATPAQARHFLDTMRGIFQWAVDADLVKADPTDGVKPPASKTKGFPVWTDEDMDAFERKWALGTRQRVAYALLLYTGLRRGDAVRVGRQHVRDGILRLRTEKTGIEVAIPILPDLSIALEKGPTGDLAYIVGEKGAPMTKEAFGNWFSEACRAGGVRKSAHGLRKAGATRAANNGATVAQLEAIFGWSGGGMASLYTRSANREKLARDAAPLMAKNVQATSIPAPGGKVRGSGRKR